VIRLEEYGLLRGNRYIARHTFKADSTMSIPNPEFFVYGAAGAASLELLKVYDYRDKFDPGKYYKLLKSGLYWGIVIGMLLASGFIAWAANAEKAGVAIWQVVVTGIAARSIVRELGTVKEATSPTTLGASEPAQKRVSLRDVFQ
jgi:hypothetical protein